MQIKLKKHFKLVIMSDSDGNKSIKLKRLNVVGMRNLFDLILTADDVHQNKPNKRFYDKIFKTFSVSAHDCMMFGDKPTVDLKLAKQMGLSTCWVKHGWFAKTYKDRHPKYVDHEISNLKEIPPLLLN